MRKLGTTQLDVLRGLIDYKGWSPGCGWVWDNVSGTARVLESLVKRGLARREARGDGVPPTVPYGFRYEATDAGKTAIKEATDVRVSGK